MININSKYNNYNIIIVGLGGTGSHLISFLSQLIGNRKDKELFKITLIDDDIVETKNVKNQKFLLKDVGRSKVEVLSCRYNSIYKLNIQYCTKRIEEENDIQTLLDCSSINIIVSCVDNNKTRHIIDNVFNYGSKNRTVIYIDTGNSGSEGDFTGQTVVGYKTNTQIILPSVGNYFEEIEKEEEDIEEASCGEVLPNQIQNISANITSAVNVFNIMNIIITFNKIPADLVLFNATKITTNNMKLYDKNLDNLSYKSNVNMTFSDYIKYISNIFKDDNETADAYIYEVFDGISNILYPIKEKSNNEIIEEIGSYGYAITGIKSKESIKILKKIFLLKKFNITSFDLIVWTNSMAFAVIPYNEDKVLMNIKCIEDAFNITSRLSIKDIFDMIKYNFNINEGE